MTTVDVILELMKPEKGAVTINSINMQQQRGDDACGVFTIAVATALCHKDDPITIQWNQDLMWQHVLQCFEAGKMTPFPVERLINSSRTCEIYYICRNWYKAKDTMKCCAKCMKWYHVACINTSNPAPRIKYKAWHCSYCN